MRSRKKGITKTLPTHTWATAQAPPLPDFVRLLLLVTSQDIAAEVESHTHHKSNQGPNLYLYTHSYSTGTFLPALSFIPHATVHIAFDPTFVVAAHTIFSASNQHHITSETEIRRIRSALPLPFRVKETHT